MMGGRIDLTGKMFGNIEVLESAGTASSGHAQWRCQCKNCGKIYVALGTNLKRKNTQSCGCLAPEQMKRIRFDTTKDLLGKKYGSWRVKYKSNKRNTSGAVMWMCECGCGNEKLVSSNSLRRGTSKC